MHLNLFPAAGLDTSLMTAVLVGLYVRFFFTESFGWVFSGLVVPGYLAAVAIVLPVSAVVTVFEATLTLMCVQGVSALLSHTRLGTPVFGRDRFVWIVVTSIAVRLLLEGFLAGPLRHALLATWGIDPSEGFGFYGIGLVLTPLLANACWKPGLARGLVQSLVTTAITYGLLRALQATTNLSLGSLQLSFERVAVDFAASPKAYLLILAGALIASHANLRFGWDTSGVMIPGLLCLGWFAPQRALSTLLEAGLLAGVAVLFLRLPGPREWNVEGPRRIVLVFSLAYVLEFLLLHALPANASPADLLGVGYLLSSLLAVKIWQKKNPALILVPAAVLSLLGLVAGSLVGFGLQTAFALFGRGASERTTREGSVSACAEDTTLRRQLWLARARSPATFSSPLAPRITSAEVARFERLVRSVRKSAQAGCEGLNALRNEAASLGLVLADASDPEAGAYVAIFEAAKSPARLRSFGTTLIARAPQTRAALVLTHPRDVADPDLLLALARAIKPAAVLVSALDRDDLRGDPDTERNTPVRAAAAGLEAVAVSVLDTRRASTQLSRFVASELAAALETAIGPFTRGGFGTWSAQLRLSADTRARLLASVSGLSASQSIPSLWAKVDDAQVPAHLSALEVKVWMDDVLRPSARSRGPMSPAKLSRVKRAARALGLPVAEGVGHQAVVLGFGPRGNGGLVLWTGVERERALIESASLLPGIPELTLRLASRLQARALLVKGRTDTARTLADASRASIALGPALPPLLHVLSQRREAPTTLYVPHGSAWKDDLLAAARSLGLEPRVRSVLDDRTAPHVQALFEQRLQARAATLAVSRADRARFEPAKLTGAELSLLSRLQIPTRTVDITEYLLEVCASAEEAAPAPQLGAWVSSAQLYADEHSPAVLSALKAQATRLGLRFEVATDLTSEEVFLTASAAGRRAALLTRPGSTARTLSCPADASAVADALDARAGVVVVERQP